MSYPINYPTPQNADVQIFSQGGTTSDWVKPQGCTFVYMMLIGAGGNGASGTSASGGGGGAHGTITKALIPAFLIPDVLRVRVAAGGEANGTSGSQILYQLKATTAYNLINAPNGLNATGTSGAATTTGFASNQFTCAGFVLSHTNNAGASGGGSISVSTNFLTSGAGGATTGTGNAGSVTPAYSYPLLQDVTSGENGRNGYFFIQPVIIGCGGAGGAGSVSSVGGNGGKGGIGCGGGGGGFCGGGGTSQGGSGGDGLVIIISW